MAFESLKERAEALESEVYTLYLAFRHARTPLVARVVIVLIVAYAVSPIDPIPDVIPVLGYLDELVVLPIGVAVALWLVPDEVVDECRERARDEIDIGRGRWIVAGIVVLTWIVIGVLAVGTLTDWV